MAVDAADAELARATIAELFAAAPGDDRSDALDGFGADEFLATEPGVAVPAIFGAQGATASRSHSLHLLLTGILDGHLGISLRGAGVLLGSQSVDGASAVAGDADVRVRGLHLGGVVPERGIAAVAGGRAIVEFAMADALVTPIQGLDPSLQLAWVEIAVPADRALAGSEVRGAWAEAATHGRIAIAHELLGAVGSSLDLAVEHATGRVQFGRAIGSFQAVKHKLADVLIALEAGRAAAEAASEEPGLLASYVAKSMAGRAADVAARNCLQVLGGMGFTEEHPLHRFQKRNVVLDRLLGSAASLPRAIERELVAGGGAPRLVEL